MTFSIAAMSSGASGSVRGPKRATGTPSGVGYARTPPWLLQPGDVVEVEVDRLGILRNTVVGNGARLTAGKAAIATA